MAAETIHCPGCEHPVRVPDSLFGQAVRCPKCKAYFRAPVLDADGNLGAPELLPTPPARPARSEAPRPPISGSPLFVPGLFLLLVGAIGTIVNGYRTIETIADPDAAAAASEIGLKEFAKLTKQEMSDEFIKKSAQGALPAIVFFGFVSVIPILAAWAMLKMRFWHLAVTGSVIAMFNPGTCCCVIGMPVGIYCLIKLFDPDVRALFSRPG